MTAINATLLAVNDTLTRVKIRLSGSTQHGLSNIDQVAIALGCLLGFSLLVNCYAAYAWMMSWPTPDVTSGKLIAET